MTGGSLTLPYQHQLTRLAAEVATRTPVARRVGRRKSPRRRRSCLRTRLSPSPRRQSPRRPSRMAVARRPHPSTNYHQLRWALAG